MLNYSVILLLMSNAICLRRDKSIIYSKIIMQGVLLTIILVFDLHFTAIYGIFKDYIGLINIFIFFNTIIVLNLAAFYIKHTILPGYLVKSLTFKNISFMINYYLTFVSSKLGVGMNDIFFKILSKKNILNSMSFSQIMKAIWHNKRTIFYSCLLAYSIRVYTLDYIFNNLIEYNNKLNNIPFVLLLIITVYFFIYSIILGLINKYTIVCSIIVRIVLFAVLILSSVDYISCILLLDLWFHGWLGSVGHISLNDNFGQWSFAKDNPYGEGSSSGPNYTRGTRVYESTNSEESRRQIRAYNPFNFESDLTLSPEEQDNSKKPAKSYDMFGDNIFRPKKLDEVFPPEHILTIYPKLSEELQTELKEGNESPLSKSIRGSLLHHFPGDIAIQIWEDINPYILYPSQITRFHNVGYYLKRDMYHVIKCPRYIDLSKISFWCYESFDYKTKKDIASSHSFKIGNDTTMFGRDLSKWERLRDLHLYYVENHKLGHDEITSIEIKTSIRNSAKPLIAPLINIHRNVDSHFEQLISLFNNSFIKAHRSSFIEYRAYDTPCALIEFEQPRNIERVNRDYDTRLQLFNSPILSKVYWLRSFVGTDYVGIGIKCRENIVHNPVDLRGRSIISSFAGLGLFYDDYPRESIIFKAYYTEKAYSKAAVWGNEPQEFGLLEPIQEPLICRIPPLAPLPPSPILGAVSPLCVYELPSLPTSRESSPLMSPSTINNYHTLPPLSLNL